MSSTTDKPLKEDFLDEDPEIQSQRYVLLSFISPENVLAKKENFFFEKFMEDYEFQVRTRGFEEFLGIQVQKLNDDVITRADVLEASGNTDAAELLRKNRIRVDDFLGGFQEYVRKNQRELTQTKIVETYKDFLSRKQVDLEDKFFATNDFRTTIRGMKVRGSYASTAEAEARAKKLQRSDQYHNILVGEVGKWLSWDPNPGQIENHEYAEEQLNELMKKYKENEDSRDQFYKERNMSKPNKKVFGTSGEVDTVVSDSVTDTPATTDMLQMFGDSGDLAIKRKMESAVEAMKKAE